MRTPTRKASEFGKRESINLLSNFDRFLLLLFAVSFALCIVAIVLSRVGEQSVIVPATFASAPLAVVGIAYCIYNRKRYVLALAVITPLVMLILNTDFNWILVTVSIMVGLVGVLALVSILQRAIFYPVIASIELINIKGKLTLFDRMISFLFSISGDIDTRNIEIDYNLNRASIPWKEVASTLRISFMAGLFIWIYISMNPSWMSYGSLSSVPVYLFSVMLYIPLIVMPFSIFMSMNARISTRYKDFMIYDGVKMTLYRMVVPVFAAFIYILLAVNESGIMAVIVFITLSVLFNLIINTAACLIFYRWFESSVVNDVRSGWYRFRPYSMTMVIEDEKSVMKEDVPDTPRRDMSDLGVMVFAESQE
ncbi:MAG: hypothetical protein ACI4Q9_02750 [Candidatus Methanomethylophilaceae archaeon]